MMDQIIPPKLRVRHRPVLRLVEVARVEQLSPRMRRITFTGSALDGFVSLAADDHVKLFFPAPGQDRPVLPVPGEDGSSGAARPIARDYTPRRFDSARRELVVEFVLHGDGPASSWASQATPGRWLGVGGPRGSRLIPDDCDTTLLAGDETALPAIARHLEEMPAGVRALVLIEVADAREERHLPTAANAAVTWLHRNGVPAGRSTLLDRALRDLMLPAGSIYAWLAAEFETAKRLRDYLVEEEGLARDQIRAAGYWRRGDVASHSRLDDE